MDCFLAREGKSCSADNLVAEMLQELGDDALSVLAEVFRIRLQNVFCVGQDHAWDVYDLRCEGEQRYDERTPWFVYALICDISDAFMTVPLHPSESPFTVAEVRDPASPTGTYIYL